MTDYLIWSNQHRMWWRPNKQGYTEYIEEAGRYDREWAERIVSSATLDGALAEAKTNPVTGEVYWRQAEVMVLAPEDIPQETR